jgi:NAD(P)H-flavin reductase
LRQIQNKTNKATSYSDPHPVLSSPALCQAASHGRPDLNKEVLDVSTAGAAGGGNAVFACGPTVMVAACEKAASELSVDFFNETFEL